MTRNPDPKPGRWLLPLVVAGLIGFTYVFVNALDPGTVPDSSSTTTAATTTSTITSTAATTTTTTTIPLEFAAFLDEVAGFEDTVATLAGDAAATNNAWEERSIDYGTTGANLADLAERTEAFVTAITEAEAPPLLEPVWLEVGDAALAMQVAADGMVTGLAAPDTGEARRAALEEFQTAVTDFNAKMARLREAAGAS